MIQHDIIPSRIKQARVSRGYSMADLGNLVGVSRQAISKYEIGTYTPTEAVLSRIASVLRYEISFFRKPLPSDAASPSTVFFRSRRSTTKKSKEAAKEKIAIFQEIDKYLRQFVSFPKVNLPTIDYHFTYEQLNIQQIEEFAIAVRNNWGLGNAPIVNLTNVFQKNGIMISVMNLNNKKIDAFSVWKDAIPYIFLSSEKYSDVRLRFTLAHELGHLLLHANYINEEEIQTKVIFDKIEKEADLFAAALLLPATTFSNDIYSTSIDHFINLKKKWKASIGSMIYRCQDLDLLTENQIKYLKDQMSYNHYWKSEPLDNIIPLEQPFAHKQAFDLILDNHIVTETDVVEEIGCEASEIEEYSFLEKGRLTPSSIPDNIIHLF
ncbi:helix-turn-helix domain-containing protein [Anaerostipes sp.]|jgi:Zn-dependent peptidase ImmA (M78 family)/transcriptional regulator with XRE-family HTH domain|uniref:helix-turn-helix domain-containing protein n=1 Tax=Anaerostipes sp. TaxID=1872530 RepID=UPI003967261A